MMVALAWLRKWGTWILVGVLLAACGVMWLMMRALRAKAEAHAMTDTVIDLGRKADAAYARAKGESAAKRDAEVEAQIKVAERKRDQELRDQEDSREDYDALADQELAAHLRRRFGNPGGSGDPSSGI